MEKTDLRIRYLSQSVIPSQAANSVHVMKMCEAFSENGHDVELICRRGHPITENSISEYYGVAGNFDLRYFGWPSVRFMGALSYAAQIGRYLAKHRQKIDLVYSRCPYSTLMACGVGLPFIYEAHALPRTVFHRSLEAIILKSRWLQSFVVISRALKKDYMSIFPWLSERPMVAHDGASVTDNRIEEEVSQNDHQFKVIYTGSLLPGKGVELVVDLSWRLSQYDFHIIGGPSEVWRNKYRSEDTLKNLHYHGFLSPSLVRQWQEKADILLLPNQSQVFTDAGRVDIGRWTSPLKLFEYMASHTPIVASDLPVIREVLTHGENALLAKPEFPESWVQAINHLNKDRQLAARIADCAYQDLIQNYTWKQRANKVLL